VLFCNYDISASKGLTQMAKKTASKTSDVSFITIRIDPSLHMRLSKAAIDSERSLNSEIAHRLALSFLPNRESPELAQAIETMHRQSVQLDKIRAELAEGRNKLMTDTERNILAEEREKQAKQFKSIGKMFENRMRSMLEAEQEYRRLSEELEAKKRETPRSTKEEK
jgi:hypothetical protein